MNNRTSQFLVGAAMLGLLAGNAALGSAAGTAEAGPDGAVTPAKEAHHCKTGGHCMGKAKGKAKGKAGKKADKEELVPAPAPAEPTETR